MGTDADDTLLVKVLGRIFTHVGDVGSEFLHSALGVTDLCEVLVDMDGSEDVPLDHLLG